MTWNPKIEIRTKETEISDRAFLGEAYRFAWHYSQDPDTKTGAVLVSPNLEEVLAYGTNHFPEGVKVKIPSQEEMQDKEKLKAWKNWKYAHIIHAEPAAIFTAAKKGKATEGATMYMPWIPCTPCAKAIIDAGIKTLIGHKEMIMMKSETLWESMDYALTLLKNAGVEKFMYDGKIGGVKALFGGKEWEP